tara:strand:+ start:677 stop:2527 length:1851 start_codon:yes stop_codon:yes gene_type:complete
MHAYQLKSVELMHDKSEKAVQCATSGDLHKARELVDELRFLRAAFASVLGLGQEEQQQDTTQKEYSKNLAQLVSKLNTNFETIAQWLNAAQAAFPQQTLFQSKEGINIYLDSQIPAVWNWLEDIIIIQEDPEKEFTTALRARGQKKIIVLAAGDNQKDICYLETPDDALPGLRDWAADPVGRTILISNALDPKPNETLMKEIREVFLCFIIGTNTVRNFSRTWALQQIRNVTRVVSHKNVMDLAPIFNGKKCIIVSPGPSLKNNIALLEDHADEHIVIAVAQACPALLKHSIYPDYVMVVDPKDYSHVLEGTDCSKIPGLIIGDVCHPTFYAMPFQNIFTYFAVAPALDSANIMSAEPQPLFGGSVSVAATDLAIKLGAKEICLIGSDLSFTEEIYYGGVSVIGGGATRAEEVKTQPFTIPGYFGGEVTTKPDYLSFKREFEQLAAENAEELTFNNCTEGGAYIQGFNHIPLAEVLSREIGLKKNLALPENSANAIRGNLKNLLRNLLEERTRLNKVNILARECMQLAEKISDPSDKKLAALNKKEKKLILATNSTKSLDLFCTPEIEAIQRQIERINSFEGNIALSKSMYQMIFDAIEEIRLALSEQIAAIKTLN